VNGWQMNNMQGKSKYQSGFTLLEILVSLALLTIALTAIITVGSSRAETLLTLREQGRALIVANNVLEEYYLKQPISVGVYDGQMENGSINWNWQISIQTTNNDYIYRMDVKVSKNRDFAYSSAQLSGFKWHE
jgi:type II secretion system protein I